MLKYVLALLCLVTSNTLTAHSECDWKPIMERTMMLTTDGGTSTGFLLNNKNVLSAYHSMKDIKQYKATHFPLYDITVLHIPQIKDKLLPHYKIVTPHVGEMVHVFGIPFGNLDIRMSIGYVISDKDTYYLTSAFVIWGMSGGATFVCRDSTPYLIGSVYGYTYIGKDKTNTGFSHIMKLDLYEFKEAASLISK